VKRLFCLLLVACLTTAISGCGNVFVRGTLLDGVSTVTGSVSVVQLSAVVGDGGTTVQVTFVTLLQSGMASTIGFCGDHRDQFPMQQIIRAQFNPGTTCASIVAIVIV
jgi:hypothetical protein